MTKPLQPRNAQLNKSLKLIPSKRRSRKQIMHDEPQKVTQRQFTQRVSRKPITLAKVGP